jgi:hypothetical protein
MVDVEEIKALLKKYFTILGNVTIQPDGVVDVKGQVLLKKKVKQFPVQFGDVSEAFACYEKSLTTLIGSPRRVGGDFTCWENALITLQGAPDYVGGNFWCNTHKLVSLQGAPAHVGGTFFCTYNAHLPLLRLSMYNRVLISHAPDPVKEIMDKYVGQGKVGALKAAAELIKAGYKDNARW